MVRSSFDHLLEGDNTNSSLRSVVFLGWTMIVTMHHNSVGIDHPTNYTAWNLNIDIIHLHIPGFKRWYSQWYISQMWRRSSSSITHISNEQKDLIRRFEKSTFLVTQVDSNIILLETCLNNFNELWSADDYFAKYAG